MIVERMNKDRQIEYFKIKRTKSNTRMRPDAEERHQLIGVVDKVKN